VKKTIISRQNCCFSPDTKTTNLIEEDISSIGRSALLISEMSSGKGEPRFFPGHAMQKIWNEENLPIITI